MAANSNASSCPGLPTNISPAGSPDSSWLLRDLEVPVVGVERDRSAPWLPLARQIEIPVLVGDGTERHVLEKLRLSRARALVAAGSNDLDNIAVAVTASAVSPSTRVILRTGEQETIAETRGLMPLGLARDVTELPAAFVVARLTGEDVDGVFVLTDGLRIRDAPGSFRTVQVRRRGVRRHPDPAEQHLAAQCRIVVRHVNHVFDLPLDHHRPGGERLSVYAREVTVDPGLPWLLFLAGGPGFPAPRPLGHEGWLRRALHDFRVLLLDQRGTGRSTPVTRSVALARGAEFLVHFRADAIVRDAEVIRESLVGDEPWTVLGQSFGGFCTLSYLSFAPAGLRAALITGGLPPVGVDAADAYRALYRGVLDRNRGHYRAHPEDADIALRVVEHLDTHDVRLPDGRRLTARVLQLVGNLLGQTDGSLRLHYLLEAPFSDGQLTDAFLYGVADALSWASTAHPLYYLLHEATYADGAGPTSWAAQRVRDELPEFDAVGPLLFTGEMIYPWMFDNTPDMAGLRPVADQLAARRHWTPLYDPGQLAANQVPTVAAVYDADMYVDCGLSLAAARSVGNLRVWHTDEHQHDGLRVSDGVVLDHVLSMLGTGR